MPAVKAWLQLARPLQWVKNGFVLLPLLFGHALLQADAVLAALIATAAFCLASSAVYAANDIVDAERDRRHPDKCMRPLARGVILPRHARLFSFVLALAGLLLAWSVSPRVAAVIAAYLLLQVAYSGGLKRIAYVDVLIIASGFALRIVAGGFAADVPLTRWIVVMGFL
ncbi:MAG: UbiA prenyltransferase family protein, partial [Dokdonella sp.]